MDPMLATVPKSTMGVAPSLKFEPSMVTLPAGTSGPDVCDTDVTVGASVGA